MARPSLLCKKIMDIHFDGELSCRPISLEDLARDNESLTAIYEYSKTITDPELQKHIDRVLRMASDELCNTCHEMNIDPFILDYWRQGQNYIVTPFKPETLD